VNFGVMPVKGYTRIETGNAQNFFSRCLFLAIEKRSIFGQVLLILKKKKKKKNKIKKIKKKRQKKNNNIVFMVIGFIFIGGS